MLALYRTAKSPPNTVEKKVIIPKISDSNVMQSHQDIRSCKPHSGRNFVVDSERPLGSSMLMQFVKRALADI